MNDEAPTTKITMPDVPTPANNDRIAALHNAPSSSLAPIRTFQSDVADAIKEKQGSVLKIAVAEQERKQQEQYVASPAAPKNKAFIFGTVVFLILGASTLAYFIISQKQPVVQNVEQSPIVPIIFADVTKTLDVTDKSKPAFLQILRAEIQSGLAVPEGKIKFILLSEKTDNGTIALSTQKFLETIGAGAPGQLVRALEPDFMAGIFQNTAPKFFLLYNVDSYDNAFAGTYSWEKKMVDDLFALYGLNVGNNGQGILTKEFQSATIKNQDARVLYDDSGHMLFYYTFIGNRHYLLIAEDEETLGEVLTRIGQVNR